MRTPQGEPIPGVWISAALRDAVFVEPVEEASRLRTDSSGSATLGALPADSAWLFVRNGFVSRTALASELSSAQIGEPAEVVLERGRTLDGIVVDPWGQPISGALVEARGRFGEALSILGIASAGPRAAADLRSSVTGEDGRFRIEGITAFPVDVTASSPDHLLMAAAPGVGPRSEAGEIVRVVLAPLLAVGLDVRDATTNGPISTANVVVQSFGGFDAAGHSRMSRRPDTHRAGWSDDHSVHWSTWLPGSLRTLAAEGKMPPRPEESEAVAFAVDAIGYRPQEVLVVPGPPAPNGVASATPVRLVRLDATPSDGNLTIRLNTEPAPLPRSVTLRGAFVAFGTAAEEPVSFSTEIDDAGVAHLRVPAGRYRLAVTRVGAALWIGVRPEAREADVPPSGSADLTIRLSCARLRGHVRDARGGRLAAFLVNMSGSRNERGGVGSMAFVSGDAFVGHDEWATTRSERSPGDFDFLLAPGKYGVVVGHRGFQEKSEALTLADGDDRVMEIVLQDR